MSLFSREEKHYERYAAALAAMAVSTEAEHNCYKMSAQFGWVRVLVYVFLPIAVILLLQLILLSRLRHYDEKIKGELKGRSGP